MSGKEILTAYCKQHKAEGYISLEDMIDNAIQVARRDQDRDTRHACAEAVIGCNKDVSEEYIKANDAHSACMNVKAYFKEPL